MLEFVYKTKFLHPICVNSSRIGLYLSAGAFAFFSKRDKEHRRNNSNMHLEDFTKAVKCFGCNKGVTNQILCAIGRAYHPECFVCHACSKPLEGLMFGVDAEDNILCREDYTKAYSPTCSACQRTIAPLPDTGETVRVVAMGREFHIDCYKCQDCGIQLTDEVDKRCYPLGDLLLCYFCHRDRKKPHRKVVGSNGPSFFNPNVSRLGGYSAMGAKKDRNNNSNNNYKYSLPQPSSV